MKNWKYIEGAKTGNAGITDKEFNSENEMRRWCIEHNYTYTPVGGGYYRLEDDSGKNRNDLEAHVKAGNKTGNEKTGAEEFFKQLSDDVKEREEKDDADIEKVGNALGKDIYQHKLDPNQYMVVDWDKDTVTIIVNGVVRDVIKNTDKVAYAVDHVYKRVNSMNKVGNALNWDENLVGKFVWVKDKGQEWKVYVMQDKGDKVYIRDDDGSQGWVSKTRITGKVGNSKTGNATPNYRYKDFLITNPEGHEYIVFLKDGRTVGYRGTTSKAQAEDWCDWHDPKTGKPIGNKTGNSAQDDKFAYVMREFDEGKLKTPDGKVVTDPAQAKAIAYSESKKTENGLARARNAIKKS